MVISTDQPICIFEARVRKPFNRYSTRIGREETVNWSGRSQNLTKLDFFVWTHKISLTTPDDMDFSAFQ